MQQVNLPKLETQKLEVQKAAQSGQSQVGERMKGAIAESSAKSTKSSTGETLFLVKDSQLEDSQPVEIESTEPTVPLSSRVSSNVSPTDVAPEKSFEGYYDQRYFENSY